MNKTFKIILIALAVLVLAGAIAFTIFYINVNAISFDYVDNHYTSHSAEDGEVTADILIPYFGNKLTLDGAPLMYDVPFNLGIKNLKVYNAVNSPIELFAMILSTKYDFVRLTDYSVLNEGGKTLTVTLNGTAKDGEETIPIEKVFVFDIENASLDNLPTWTNRTEEDDEVYQYLQ